MNDYYKIDIFNKITGLNEKESGIYTGDLKEILLKLPYNDNEIDREIKVKKINVKTIDDIENTKLCNIKFACNDTNIDLSFAKKISLNEYIIIC